ncbi:MAG: MBL fold metallo-hydrolase [Chitinophagaceae bacterium]|nr:MAG: MBL fold metallo-hydrolase [Chitinophagaceae bacterium]
MIACQCIVCSSKNKKDNRLRSSILIKSEKTVVVVDTTPDFRYQMLRSNVNHLDAILFTHSHKDHIAGLDDIKAYNFISQRPMSLFANTETCDALRRDFYYAFADKKYPGIPQLDLNLVEDEPFSVMDIDFMPIKVKHLNMDVHGYRFGDFTYITDANHIDDSEKEKIKGTQVLVVNALRKEKHLSHFTLQEAIDLATDLEIPTTYFTHLSHQMGLHDEVSASLPKGMFLAYDGLVLNVNNA